MTNYYFNKIKSATNAFAVQLTNEKKRKKKEKIP